MKRRSFIQSLIAFTGLVALDWKFEFTRAFPFVRRRPRTPQWIATTTATGEMSITLPIPDGAQKDDMLIAVVASLSPDGPMREPQHVPGWTWYNSCEQDTRTVDWWYNKTNRDLRGETVTFSRKGAVSMAGQLSVIRGADIERAPTTTKA